MTSVVSKQAVQAAAARDTGKQPFHQARFPLLPLLGSVPRTGSIVLPRPRLSVLALRRVRTLAGRIGTWLLLIVVSHLWSRLVVALLSLLVVAVVLLVLRERPSAMCRLRGLWRSAVRRRLFALVGHTATSCSGVLWRSEARQCRRRRQVEDAEVRARRATMGWVSMKLPGPVRCHRSVVTGDADGRPLCIIRRREHKGAVCCATFSYSAKYDMVSPFCLRVSTCRTLPFQEHSSHV